MPSKLAPGFWQRERHRLLDSHCHLSDGYTEAELQDILGSDVRIHNMSVTPWQYLENVERYSTHPQVKNALGLFPLEPDADRVCFEKFMELLPSTKYIGEIGLDFSYGAPARETQIEQLKTILKQAHRQGGTCVSLHSRRAGTEIIDICSKLFDGVLICHWFSGPVSSLKNIPDHLYFSVNTAMLQSRSGKTIITALPRDRVLLESDGPYVKTGGESASPLHMPRIVEALAHRWSMGVEEALEQICHNIKRATTEGSDFLIKSEFMMGSPLANHH